MIKDIDRIIKTGPYAYMTGREKFWMYVNVGPDDSCWEWMGDRWSNEYGDFGLFNRGYLAHRVSYWLHHGGKIKGLSVCHKCDNPPCVNPHHLFLGTAKDNIHDMLSKGRGNPCLGSRGYQAFLTEIQAAEIKWLTLFTPIAQQRIADLYNIPNPNTVSRIKTGTRWPHVEPRPVNNWEKLLNGNGDNR